MIQTHPDFKQISNQHFPLLNQIIYSTYQFIDAVKLNANFFIEAFKPPSFNSVKIRFIPLSI